MKINFLRIVVSLSFASVMTFAGASPSAHAASDASSSPSSWVGALGGVGIFNNSLGTQATFGLNAGYKLAPTYSAGLILFYQPITSIAPPGSSTSAGLITLAAEGNYFLDQIVSGLRAGAKVGMGLFAVSTTPLGGTSTSSNTVNLVFGPHVAYDYALGGALSVGGEVNYLLYTQSPITGSLNLLAVVKYGF